MKKALEILSDKKIKKIITISLIVLFILVIAIIIIKNKPKKTEEQQQETPTDIVIDEKVKEQLSNYIKELSTGPYCEFPTNKEFTNDCIYRNETIDKDKLTINYRISSLIFSIGESKTNNIMIGNITIDGKSFYNPHYVDASEVKKEYTSLYGEETFNPSSINSISNYSIRYDEGKNKFFYLIPESTEFVSTYIEKYESTPEAVNVYVRVGYISYEGYRYHLYNNKNKEIEIANLTTREYKEGNIINDSNYTSLDEYVFTFVKDKDNLVFKQVNIIK